MLSGVVVAGLALDIGMHKRYHSEPVPGVFLRLEIYIELLTLLIAPPSAPLRLFKISEDEFHGSLLKSKRQRQLNAFFVLMMDNDNDFPEAVL